jgi:hypothetical protein
LPDTSDKSDKSDKSDVFSPTSSLPRSAEKQNIMNCPGGPACGAPDPPDYLHPVASAFSLPVEPASDTVPAYEYLLCGKVPCFSEPGAPRPEPPHDSQRQRDTQRTLQPSSAWNPAERIPASAAVIKTRVKLNS